MGKSLPLKKELWALLEMGNSEAWKEIEEFADSLIIKGKVLKQS